MVEPIEFTMTARVRASPDRVWAVLGDFGTEHRWLSLLTHSERDTADVRVGTVRRCELAKPVFGARTIHEELVDYRPAESLAYRVRGGIGPFALAESRWHLRALPDGGTLVEARALLTPRSALVRALFAPFLRLALRWNTRSAMREFAAFVEARAGTVPA